MLSKALRFSIPVSFLLLCGSVEAVPPSAQYVPGEILVKVDNPATTPQKGINGFSFHLPPQLEDFCRQRGLDRVLSLAPQSVLSSSGRKALSRSSSPSSNRGVFLLKFAEKTSVNDVVADLETQPDVVYAEPNYIGSLCAEPADIYYASNQQPLYRDLLGLEQAWDHSIGSASVTIAILDSGIDELHPEFAGRIVPGTNVLEGTSNVQDPLGHGTRVAGILGARGNDSGPESGMAGVCWECRLMPVVVAGTDQKVTVASAAQAIDYAWRNGADVINMSFTIGQDSQTLKAACHIGSQHAVLVAAAGNQGQNLVPLYPAAYEPVLSVAALESATERAEFSNYNLPGVNDFVDLAAPGVGIFTTLPGGLYNGSETVGTSFACPLVAGVAGILKGLYPHQSSLAISNHLERHSANLDDFVIWGRLDAGAALSAPLLPNLVINETSVQDGKNLYSGNDADGALDGGEDANIILNIANTGGDITSSTLELTLISNDANITVTTSMATLPRLVHGQSIRNVTAPFTVHVSADPPQTNASMALRANGLPDINFILVIEEEAAIPQEVASDLTLTADRTWIATGLTTVATGATLTAQPGTTVKFENGAQLDVWGNLMSVGTVDDPIRWKNRTPLADAWFQPGTEFPLGDYGTALAVGDVNRDGVPDIVSGRHGLRTMYGDGTGGFLPPQLVANNWVHTILFADATRDGVPDILATEEGTGEIFALPGLTSGGFGARILYHSGPSPGNLAYSDLTGDGIEDIATVYNSINQLIVLRGVEPAGFVTHVTMTIGNQPTFVCTSDFDKDGDDDLAVGGGFTGQVSLFVNDGSGTFTSHPQSPLSIGGIPYGIAFGDLTKDGWPDLVVGHSQGIRLFVAAGGGPFNTFSYTFAGGYAVRKILLEDLNMDGRKDVLAIGSANDFRVFITPDTGAYNSVPDTRFSTGSSPSGFVYGLVGPDSIPDVVISNHDGQSVSYFSGGGEGSVLPYTSYPTATNPITVSLGDITGDNVPDAVVPAINQGLMSVFPANTDGTFGMHIDYPAGTAPRDAKAEDIDGDGLTDVVAVDFVIGSGSVMILQGIPSGGLSGPIFYTAGVSPIMVDLEDLNLDGFSDIAVGHYGPTSNLVHILLSDATGSYVVHATVTSTFPVTSVLLADITSDGITDLIAPPVIFAGVGGGNFASSVEMPDPWDHRLGVACGDVTGDTISDLVFPGIRILPGDGLGGFLPEITVPSGQIDQGNPRVTDLNSDGRNDIVLSEGSSIYIRLGSAGGTFLPGMRLPAGGGTRGTAIRDLTGDGFPELCLVNYQTHNLFVYLNDGLGGLGLAPQVTGRDGSTTVLGHSSFELQGPVALLGDGSVSSCNFESTGGTGLAASNSVAITEVSATHCQVGFIVGPGSGGVSRLFSAGNRSVGMIVGDASACRSIGNHESGIVSTGVLLDCLGQGNGDFGLYSATEIMRGIALKNSKSGMSAPIVTSSQSRQNTLTGIIAADRAMDSIAVSNGAGIQSPTIENCLIIGTYGSALSGAGTVNDSVMLENQSVSTDTVQFNAGAVVDNDGSSEPTSIQNMYIAGNTSGGVDGIPIATSSIIGNHGSGIANNIHAASSNIAFNTGEGVIGGTISNCYVHGNPLGDLVGATGNTVPSPVEAAPAFLASVTLDRPQPIGVGGLNVDLTFSKDMKTSQRLWVTFGAQPPYTSFVMKTSPGWDGNRTWRGFFPISGEVGSGTHTLRVSGAVSLDGFSIPPDTYHKFQTDTEGGLSLYNGRVIERTPTSLTVSWDPSEDAQVLGFAVLRSPLLEGPFQKVGEVSFPVVEFQDSGLQTDVTYFYNVYEYDTSLNHRELVQPFSGTTGESFTPTPTMTQTFTPTPTATPMLMPEIWVDFEYSGIEVGSELQPYNTLAEAIARVQTGGTVKFKPGTSAEAVRVTKKMHLRAPFGGPVRLGVSGASAMQVAANANPTDLVPTPRPEGRIDARDLLVAIEAIQADKAQRSSLLEFAVDWMR